MKERRKREEASLPPCPNANCRESHVARNGSHRGRQRYCCRTCQTSFGETLGRKKGLSTWSALGHFLMQHSPSDHTLARQGERLLQLD